MNAGLDNDNATKTKPNKHPKNLSLIYIPTERNPHHDSETIQSRSTQSKIEQQETKQRIWEI